MGGVGADGAGLERGRGLTSEVGGRCGGEGVGGAPPPRGAGVRQHGRG